MEGSAGILETPYFRQLASYEILYDIPEFRIPSSYNRNTAFSPLHLAENVASRKWQSICTSVGRRYLSSPRQRVGRRIGPC